MAGNFSDYLNEAAALGTSAQAQPVNDSLYNQAYQQPTRTQEVTSVHPGQDSSQPSDAKHISRAAMVPSDRKERQDYILKLINTKETYPVYWVELASALCRQTGFQQRTDGMPNAQNVYYQAIQAARNIDQKQVKLERVAVGKDEQAVEKQLQSEKNPETCKQLNAYHERLVRWDTYLHVLQRAPGFTLANYGLACIAHGFASYGERLLVQAAQVDPEMTRDQHFLAQLQAARQVGESGVQTPQSNTPVERQTPPQNQNTQQTTTDVPLPQTNLGTDGQNRQNNLGPATQDSDAALDQVVRQNQAKVKNILTEIDKENHRNAGGSSSQDNKIGMLPSGDLTPGTSNFVSPLDELSEASAAFASNNNKLTTDIDNKFNKAISDADNLNRDWISQKSEQLKTEEIASVDQNKDKIAQLNSDIQQLTGQSNNASQLTAKKQELESITAQYNQIHDTRLALTDLQLSSGITRLGYANALAQTSGDEAKIKELLTKAVAYDPGLAKNSVYLRLAEKFHVAASQSTETTDKTNGGQNTASTQSTADCMAYFQKAVAHYELATQYQAKLSEAKDSQSTVEVTDANGNKVKLTAAQLKQSIKDEYEEAFKDVKAISPAQVSQIEKSIVTPENADKIKSSEAKYFPGTQSVSEEDFKNKLASAKTDAERKDISDLHELLEEYQTVQLLKQVPQAIAKDYGDYLASQGENDKATEVRRTFSMSSSSTDGTGTAAGTDQASGQTNGVVKPEENPALMLQAAMDKVKNGDTSTLEADLRKALVVSEKYTPEFVAAQKSQIHGDNAEQLCKQWDGLAACKGVISYQLAAVLLDKGNFSEAKSLLEDVKNNYKDIMYENPTGFLKMWSCAEVKDKNAHSPLEVLQTVQEHKQKYNALRSAQGKPDIAAMKAELDAALKEAKTISPDTRAILKDMVAAGNKAQEEITSKGNLSADDQKKVETIKALTNVFDAASNIDTTIQLEKVSLAVETKDHQSAFDLKNEFLASNPDPKVINNAGVKSLLEQCQEPHWYDSIKDAWDGGLKDISAAVAAFGAGWVAGVPAAEAAGGLTLVATGETGPFALVAASVAAAATGIVVGGGAAGVAYSAVEQKLDAHTFLTGAEIGAPLPVFEGLKVVSLASKYAESTAAVEKLVNEGKLGQDALKSLDATESVTRKGLSGFFRNQTDKIQDVVRGYASRIEPIGRMLNTAESFEQKARRVEQISEMLKSQAASLNKESGLLNQFMARARFLGRGKSATAETQKILEQASKRFSFTGLKAVPAFASGMVIPAGIGALELATGDKPDKKTPGS